MSHSNAPNPPWSAAATAAQLRTLEALIGGDGDRSEPCDGPNEDWRSDWDADHMALADENRRWRQWP